MTVPRLKIARYVTRRHGEVFAEAWFCRSAFTGDDVWKAFSATGLMEYPEENPNRPFFPGRYQDPREERYQTIEDEILERTFAAVKGAVAEAFVKAAREILARERRLQRRQGSIIGA